MSQNLRPKTRPEPYKSGPTRTQLSAKAKSGENAEPHHQIVHDGGHVDTLHENHQVTVS